MADVPSGPSLDSTPHYANLKKKKQQAFNKSNYQSKISGLPLTRHARDNMLLTTDWYLLTLIMGVFHIQRFVQSIRDTKMIFRDQLLILQFIAEMLRRAV
jgi:hypothetical protein